MAKYRKKPVVIDAIKTDSKYFEWNPVVEFAGFDNTEVINDQLFIKTLEGNMLVTRGDYIIKGVNGEFYPCKPDIFEKTYDFVE